MALVLASSAWGAPKYKLLHAFGSGKDGGGLWGSLVFDNQGNLYGTTEGGGGPYSYGTVFKLVPGTDGWTESVLHRFRGNGPAGSPQGPLTMDPAGNLYGTADDPFELSRSSGQWKLTLLHKFPSYKGDGNGAVGGVIVDASGNVYGVTELGGGGNCIEGCGIAYQLHHTPNGKWKESILHDFGTGGDDMTAPEGAFVLDAAGNLYGAADGGARFQGAVYRLSRGSDGHWKAAIQYSFTGGANGGGPSAGLALDKSGNLYGVTANGGDPNCGCGVVYKLAPSSKGKWKYTVLHRFTGYDGAQPYASLILDSKGNLYGTTATGGPDGSGVAFEITP
jgi:uncharacterized repeat protein (TIGR03803 family)